MLVGTRTGLNALRLDSGKLSWQVASPSLTAPVASDDVAVVATGMGLSGLSLVNGAELWRVKCMPSAVPLVADDERVLCTQTNGEIVAVTWDGSVAFRVKGAAPTLTPMLLGDKLLYCSQQNSLQRIDLSDRNLESRWLASAWMGTITTPPLLADGIVYFATAEKGLICARQGKR